MLEIILTNEMHNQRLFWNFDTLRDYMTTPYTFRDHNEYYPL